MIRSIIASVFFLVVIGAVSAAGQTTPEAAAPAEGETLHVLLGKSIVINVQTPLTRVLSSNPAAVETMATSPTQVVIEGKAAGVSSLILWDASGRSQVFDVVTDVDVAGLRNAIQKTYPNEHLDVEADGGHLLLTGTASNPKIVEGLNKMAGAYSKDVVNSVLVPIVHERQVMLEVRFAEVDRTALFQLGANYFTPGVGHTTGVLSTGQFGGSQISTTSTTSITSPNGTTTTTTQGTAPTIDMTNPLNLFLFRTDINFGVVVQALQSHNVLQI